MSIHRSAAVLLFSFTTIVAGAEPCGAGRDAEPAELLVTVGRHYFVDYCASCHGKDARGAGPAAAALKTPPADLTRIAKRRDGKFPSSEIAALIDGRTNLAPHGSREMPVWGRTFADQVGRDATGDEVVRGRLLILVEYLRTIQR